MPRVSVSKMHGTLNDFAVLDQRVPSIDDFAAFARAACDRRAGVGADGLIVILPSGRADARMRIFNADGSEAEMCGNGVRCAARFLCEDGSGERLRIETLAGIVEADILQKSPVFHVRLNVGTPRIEGTVRQENRAVLVSVGNPHAVIFARSVNDIDLLALGSRLPEYNVHVAAVRDRHGMDVRHHERGVGLTQACGTGAVACAAAAITSGMADSPIDVRVPGGVLRVEWDGAGAAFLTGDAVRVFDAQF